MESVDVSMDYTLQIVDLHKLIGPVRKNIV
jgi:hypothetical protein